MTYRYMTAGTVADPRYIVVWRGNISEPVATCNDERDARRIVDALNLVDAASSRVVLEWISVADHLPDDDQLVLVWVPRIGQLVMAAHSDGGWYSDDSILIKSGVTHWADPEPPNQK